MFVSVHKPFRGRFMFLPFCGTFIGKSALKHTFVHNSLTVSFIIIPQIPTCYFRPRGRGHVGSQAVP
jgi:hypothetical protein